MRHGLTTHVPLNEFNKDAAAKDLMIAEVLVTRILSLNSLLKGMNSLSLGDLLGTYPCFAKIVFPSVNDALVDIEQFCNSVKVVDGEETDCPEKELAWNWFLKFAQESNNERGKCTHTYKICLCSRLTHSQEKQK